MRTRSALFVLAASALYLAPGSASAQPANDLCENAVVQTLSIPGAVTVNGDNTGGLDNDGLGWETVWEAFTITSCADVKLDFCGSDPAYADGDWFMVLETSCPPGSDEVVNNGSEFFSCADGNLTLYFSGLPAGTYYYPVYAGGGNVGPYTINITTAVCEPAGNQAPEAGDDGFSVDVDGTLDASVADNDSDADNDNTELVWSLADGGTAEASGSLTFHADGTFSYTPDPGFEGEVSFTYTVCDPEPLCDTALATITVEAPPVNQAPDAGDDVFSVDQDSTLDASVADNDSDADNDSTELVWSLADGGTAEASGSLTFNADGTFSYTPDPGFEGDVSFTYTVCDPEPLCDTATVTITIEVPVVTPANDLCGDVTAEELLIDATLTFMGDNTGATIDGDYEPGSPLEADSLPSVWHAFTTTGCANVIVSYCGTAPAFQNVWTVLTTGCPGGAGIVQGDSVNTDDCGDGNTWIAFYDLPAGTYYLPVKLDTSSTSPAVGPYSVQVSASACETVPEPPVNDSCAWAIVLNVNLDCQPVQGTVQDATQSLPALVCNELEGDANDDVWYSFVATNPHEVISVTGGADFDAVLEFFEGTCDGLTSTACSDTSVSGGTEAIELFDLEEGTTYFVRLYDHSEGYPTDPSFSICITGDVGTQVAAQETASFGLRPNPTEGQVTIDLGNIAGPLSVDVLDLAGRLVQRERVAAVAGGSFTFNLAGSVGTGLYTVRLTSPEQHAEQRLLVR